MLITKEYLIEQFKNFNSQFLDEKYLQATDVNIKKLPTATEGMLASYQLEFTDSTGATHALGDTIDVPKDYFAKDISIKTCDTVDIPVTGYEIGDKYIDFTINSSDNSGAESHVYLAFKDFFQYAPGDGIEIVNNKINVAYDYGLQVREGKIAIKTGEGLTIDTDNAIACKFETENLDFTTLFS